MANILKCLRFWIDGNDGFLLFAEDEVLLVGLLQPLLKLAVGQPAALADALLLRQVPFVVVAELVDLIFEVFELVRELGDRLLRPYFVLL